MRSRSLLAALGLCLALAACSENPVSGRSQFAVVPDEMLAQFADQSWRDLARQVPLARDPALQARLEAVGRPIVEAADRPNIPWEFAVFDSPELNAFVLPNGKVGFFRGLMDFVQSDEELAAVMAHEVSHVLARHASERVSQQVALQTGVTIATAVLSGEEGENADQIAGALGLGATLGVALPFSRKHELEADALGVQLMRKAGRDPAAAVSLWQRMSAASARRGQPLEVLSTHPADERRLEALKTAIGTG